MMKKIEIYRIFNSPYNLYKARFILKNSITFVLIMFMATDDPNYLNYRLE